ncbi:MAG: ABC transporter ATP-binding protein [Burkholderiales bacterium]|nr:ABC transporter ATP-binding protein [Burkholderiales bacterium]
MPAALNFVDVCKHYRGVPALQDASFEVEQGAFFGLAGVNGAGKTTLIKCLLDLCAPDSGRIEIFGRPSTEVASRERLTFLPERFMPPYYLTGRAFLRMMAGLRGARYDENAALAMLERLELDPRVLDRQVRGYSKGMTQKLGLAGCLLADCDLVLLDEPMSGLDPLARALVKGLLRDLRRAGRTLFFTSHALADLEEICDRLAVLHEGRIRFMGTAAAMRAFAPEGDLESAFLRVIGADGLVSA